MDFKARFTAQFADEDAEAAGDECYQYMQLLKLAEHFESASAVAYFSSSEAREASSKARTLLANGRFWMGE